MNVLFSGTILENLRWGDKEASEEECIRACRLACADEFIQKMPEKYNTFIEQGGTNVSGGQKQRLCIARALLKKPRILILDDSTSAVDTATDAKIRKAFAEEIPDTTKLIIAQRVSSVQNADRIIVMDNGKPGFSILGLAPLGPLIGCPGPGISCHLHFGQNPHFHLSEIQTLRDKSNLFLTRDLRKQFFEWHVSMQ